ncbi:MAG: hypothetical protein IBX48_04920 [Thiomicrospira sp.]|uniref:complex I subunit 5 family protein n=1 Tax=Thiomicrospira sp. TaxID=935 RepID=UPI001A0521D4|nr:proton-conducting transporter membrane subunit [Thiomicrospira sp.]MBE0493665.1 hypothetical protein [Thiomicrospira sp.]
MSWMLPALVLWPLLAATLGVLHQKHARHWGLVGALGTAVLGVAVMGLETSSWTLGGWALPLGIGWRLDQLAQWMLLIGAIVGLFVSVYAWLDHTLPRAFWWLWLGAWGAMNALFLSADVFNIYVTLELLGISAVALVAISNKAGATQAAMRYLLVSLLGSMLFLLGVALLYGEYASLDMVYLAQQMQSGPVMFLALAAMTVGLMAKTALFPLHAWLPLAHGRAHAAVSAILSALVIKASFYLLIRLWLEVFAPLDLSLAFWFWALLGSLAVLWGATQALVTPSLKQLVAWSTVAQVGYLAIGLALMIDAQAQFSWAWGLVGLILAHALAKSAMFLAVGNIQQRAGHDNLQQLGYVLRTERKTLFAFGLAGVSLAGLPISAGFLAKWWLLELSFDHQAWWLFGVLILGSLMTAGYVLRVLNLALTNQAQTQSLQAIPAGREWLVLILASLAIVSGLSAQSLWGG